MNNTNFPQAYPWSGREVSEKLKSSFANELHLEQDEMHEALIEATSGMVEIATERLNNVPEKAYRTFLETSGADFLPSATAKTPVQFTVSNTIGDKQQEVIPEGFQVSGAIADGEEQIFETIEDLTVQKPNLSSIQFVDYYRNQKSNLSSLIEADTEITSPKRLLKGEDNFEYKLHIEHPRFAELGPESHQDLILKLTFENPLSKFNSWETSFGELFDLHIQYLGEEKVETLPLAFHLNSDLNALDKVLNLEIPVMCFPKGRLLIPKGESYEDQIPPIPEEELTKDPIPVFISPIMKSSLSNNSLESKEGYFLTLCFTPKLSQLLSTPQRITDNQSLKDFTDSLAPKINSVEYKFTDTRVGTNISHAYFNSQELDLSATFLPFGEQPQMNDCFYFSAPEIFEYGYKNRDLRIATQIMGDLTKFMDEDNPELLPYISPQPQPDSIPLNLEGTITTDQFDPHTPLQEYKSDGNCFEIKNNSDTPVTIDIFDSDHCGFRLSVSQLESWNGYDIFIDDKGAIRNQSNGEIFAPKENLEFLNIVRNAIPSNASYKIDKSSTQPFARWGVRIPFSFEFYTSPKAGICDEKCYEDCDEVCGEDCDEECPKDHDEYWDEAGGKDWDSIEIRIFNATLKGFDVELDCEYIESKTYYEKHTFSLYINEHGVIIDKNTDKEFSFYRLTTKFGVFRSIPVNGLYTFSKDKKGIKQRLGIPKVNINNSVKLSYEYYDGMDWKSFTTTGDGSKFHQTGDINLKLDTINEVKKSTLNGIEDWWLRARIIEGGYGGPAGFKNVAPHPGWMYIHNESGTPYIEPYDENDKYAPYPAIERELPVEIEIDGNLSKGPVKVSYVGPAAPLIEEVPESYKPPMIREIRVYQEDENFQTIGGEAKWSELESEGQEFLVTEDLGTLYQELPTGMINHFPADYTEQVKELYKHGGGIARDSEDPEPKVTYPTPFPIIQNPNDDTGSFPALYFGFDGENLEGTYNSLFLSLKEQPFFFRKNELLTSEGAILTSEDGIPLYTKSLEKVSRIKASLSWQYYGNKGWTELPVEDKTFGFTKSEKIAFTFPLDSQRKTVLEEDQYWIRAVIIDPELLPMNGVELRGAYQNTTFAENRTTVRNERLGSSTGFGDQTFKLRYAPTVGDLRLFVGEVDTISENELKVLYADKFDVATKEILPEKFTAFTEEAVSIIKDDNDTILSIFVEWNRVDNFVHSGPASRHYIFDHVTGTITFGDGINGMIPDVGKENIIAKSYSYGGGTSGNVPAKVISKMRNRAQIVSKVSNIAPAAGGGNGENLTELMKRGSSDLHAHDRAVTTEDYEILAKRSTTNVARAVAMSSHHPDGSVRTGHVTVAILTNDLGDRPMPSAQVLTDVQEYILERAPLQIGDEKEALREIRDRLPEELKSASFYSQYSSNIYVIPPNYVKVGIKADLHFTNPDEAQDVTSSIEENLSTFFHPLKGNYGAGWQFGETFSSGLIEQFIRRQRGVKSVSGVSLNASQLLLTMNLSLPSDSVKDATRTLNAGHFVDLYNADTEVDAIKSEKITLQVANKTTITTSPTTVSVVGFTEGDTIELLSTPANNLPWNPEFNDDDSELLEKSIISTGRISGIEKNLITARRPICSKIDNTCECSSIDRSYQLIESTQDRIAHTKENYDCDCYECNMEVSEFQDQQPIYYINTELMHVDSIQKAVMPALYESIDGEEPEITVPKSTFFEKLGDISNLEVRVVRGFTEEKEHAEELHTVTHALSARVVEVFAEDGTIYHDTHKFDYKETLGEVTPERKPFEELKGEISIVKVGIQFPSFINTNVILHNDLYGVEEPLQLDVHAVDPLSNTIHLTDWDLPYAGDFNITEASMNKNTAATGE